MLVAVLALGLGAANAEATTKPARALTAANQLESQVLVELNAIRRAHGLVPLRLSRPLASAADAHSRAMATHGFFKHESRDGSAFWHRVKRYYGPGQRGGWSVGENLLWSTTGIDASGALKLWMASPAHRENILTPRWREVGVGGVHAIAAPGVCEGLDVTILTADFGVR